MNDWLATTVRLCRIRPGACAVRRGRQSSSTPAKVASRPDCFLFSFSLLGFSDTIPGSKWYVSSRSVILYPGAFHFRQLHLDQVGSGRTLTGRRERSPLARDMLTCLCSTYECMVLDVFRPSTFSMFRICANAVEIDHYTNRGCFC